MGHDAINDILYSPRFQGAIESINWLTEFVDSKFAQFISIVAFFIISAALLRNVVAGAYAAYPKFWDMIADAKESMKGKQFSIGGQDVTFLSKVLAFCIPNLKSMSDFDDNTIEPKHYFIVAIPKMVMVVMIGLVIYNGYYRDAVAITAGFGSTILERFVLKTDPAAIVDRIFESATRPDFASDGDSTVVGKYTEKISKAAYSQIISYYTDVKDAGSKSKISQVLESNIYSFLNSHKDYMNEDKYTMKYNVDRVLGEPDLSKITANNGAGTDKFTFATCIDIRSIGFNTLMYKNESWFLRVIVRFEQKVEKIKDTGVYQDLILTIGSDQTTREGSNIKSLTILKASEFEKSGGSNYTYDTQTGKLVFTSAQNASSGIIVLNPKLPYRTADGKLHTISEIRIVDGGGGFIQSVQSKTRPDAKANVGEAFPKTAVTN